MHTHTKKGQTAARALPRERSECWTDVVSNERWACETAPFRASSLPALPYIMSVHAAFMCVGMCVSDVCGNVCISCVWECVWECVYLAMHPQIGRKRKKTSELRTGKPARYILAYMCVCVCARAHVCVCR